MLEFSCNTHTHTHTRIYIYKFVILEYFGIPLKHKNERVQKDRFESFNNFSVISHAWKLHLDAMAICFLPNMNLN